jgi:hypothetical protein
MALKALRALNVENQVQGFAVGDGSAFEDLAQFELRCRDWSFGGNGGGGHSDRAPIPVGVFRLRLALMTLGGAAFTQDGPFRPEISLTR